MTELDLRYGTGTEVSDVAGVGTIVDIGGTVVDAVVDVGIIDWRLDNTSTIGTEGESVRLRSTHDGSPLSRIKEQVRVVRRVLSLNKPIKLTVHRSLLAKYGIPEFRWIRAEVRRGVLLSLTVLHSCSDHLGLSCGVKLARGVCRVA